MGMGSTASVVPTYTREMIFHLISYVRPKWTFEKLPVSM